MEKGADLDASGGIYGTALQAAAARGKVQVLKTLLERGANVNLYGGIYGSALQGAAHNGNLESVNLLIEKGALVHPQGGVYGSALHAAMESEKVEIFQRLLQAGANVNSCGGILGGWLDVDYFFDDPKAIDVWLHPPQLRGRTFSLESGPALVWATRNSGYDQVKLLLENGAHVNGASRSWESEFPVVFKISRYLEKTSVNFESGMTALIWAAQSGKKDMIELLLEHGANLDAQSSSGETALLAASKAGHADIVRMLIECGADPSVKDASGNNAFCIAAANGHDNVMRLFANHETFQDTDDWSDPQLIEYASVDTMVVNSGCFLASSGTHENNYIGTLGMNGGSFN